MKPEHIQELIGIVSRSKDCKVVFNQPVNGSYNNARPVAILDCNATLTSDLHKAGFSLFLIDGVLVPDKF